MTSADSRQSRELARLERLRVQELDEAVRWVLSDRRGRRFWNELIHNFLVFSKGCADVSAQSHRFEGRRLAALELIALAGRVAAEPLCQAGLELIEAQRQEYVMRGAILASSAQEPTEKDDHDV